MPHYWSLQGCLQWPLGVAHTCRKSAGSLQEPLPLPNASTCGGGHAAGPGRRATGRHGMPMRRGSTHSLPVTGPIPWRAQLVAGAPHSLSRVPGGGEALSSSASGGEQVCAPQRSACLWQWGASHQLSSGPGARAPPSAASSAFGCCPPPHAFPCAPGVRCTLLLPRSNAPCNPAAQRDSAGAAAAPALPAHAPSAAAASGAHRPTCCPLAGPARSP